MLPPARVRARLHSVLQYSRSAYSPGPPERGSATPRTAILKQPCENGEAVPWPRFAGLPPLIRKRRAVRARATAADEPWRSMGRQWTAFGRTAGRPCWRPWRCRGHGQRACRAALGCSAAPANRRLSDMGRGLRPGLRETVASPAVAGPKSVPPRGPSRSWDLQMQAQIRRPAGRDHRHGPGLRPLRPLALETCARRH